MARGLPTRRQKFGAEIAILDEAVELLPDQPGEARFSVALGNGEKVKARSVVLAGGARYRRLDIPNLAEFEGSGVHYWASAVETRLCVGQEVALTGAGTPAGQCGGLPCRQGEKLWMVVRGERLEDTMSQYLIERIRALGNVEVLLRTEICGLEGASYALERVRWKHRDSGDEHCYPIQHLFSFIGAEPNTDWLGNAGIRLDEKGFVITGDGGHALATSRDGVFAVGDIRCGSIKRVASSVGEGSTLVSALHAFLAKQRAALAEAAQ